MPDLQTDVLVVGAGPAGLAAAVAAAEAGASVALIDDNPAGGGQIWRADTAGPRAEAVALIRRAQAAGCQVCLGATLMHAIGPGLLHVVQGERVLAIRCKSLILATGARERFLPFPGWDLPGVTGAGGLQALVKGGWPIDGTRVLVAGSGPLLLAVADTLRRKGARVVAVAEQAPRTAVLRFGLGLLIRPAKLRQAAAIAAGLARVPIWHDAWPIRALGRERLEGVVVRHGSAERIVEVDVLACGFGLVAQTGVAAFLGCRVERERVIVDGNQQTTLPGVYAAGEITGIGGLDLAIAEGKVAGCAAAGGDIPRAWLRVRDRERGFANALDRAFRLRPELRGLAADDTIVCRCEDVPLGSLRGFSDFREAKLETRCGMGPCQGRVCGPATAFLFGWSADKIRPPFYPLSMSTLAAMGEPGHVEGPPAGVTR